MKSITTLVNELPESGLTVTVLKALDFVVPGQWENCTDAEIMVQKATGISEKGRVQAIANHMDQLYNEDKGAQRAVWLYQTADTADKALGAAAMANKVGEKIGFLSFLNKLTPKADTIQSFDLALKLAVEMMAYASLHGLSADSVKGFVGSLNEYGNENAMRLASIICLDGLIPLGPDFLVTVEKQLSGLDSKSAEKHPVFSKIGSALPGKSTTERLGFVKNLFGESKSHISSFVGQRNLTREGLLSKLGGVIEMAGDKLDYVGAFLDAATNPIEHTGVQSVARHLAQQAAERFVRA